MGDDPSQIGQVGKALQQAARIAGVSSKIFKQNRPEDLAKALRTHVLSSKPRSALEQAAGAVLAAKNTGSTAASSGRRRFNNWRNRRP
jgi:hypothetical protein